MVSAYKRNSLTGEKAFIDAFAGVLSGIKMKFFSEKNNFEMKVPMNQAKEQKMNSRLTLCLIFAL
jgi:hypothetical protein